MICEFCNKEFKNIYTLNTHKKTAKFCLKIQNDKSNKVKKEKNKSQCSFCNKMCSTVYSLQRHMLSCKEKNSDDKIKTIIEDLNNKHSLEINEKNSLIEKLELRNENYLQQIKDQKEHVKELEDRIERLGTKAINKAGNTTNNTINFELNNFMSQDFIDNKIGNKFSDKYILDGMRGLAKFVYDHIICLEDGTLLYGCYDVSRKIFKYKDEIGNEIKDVKALKLIKLLKPGLKKQTGQLNEFFTLEHEDFVKMEMDRELSIQEKIEKEKMRYLKEKTVEISSEINDMDKNNKFTNELAMLTV